MRRVPVTDSTMVAVCPHPNSSPVRARRGDRGMRNRFQSPATGQPLPGDESEGGLPGWDSGLARLAAPCPSRTIPPLPASGGMRRVAAPEPHPNPITGIASLLFLRSPSDYRGRRRPDE